MTQLAVATGEHLFWIASRAAGIAALLLSSAAAGVGVLQGDRGPARPTSSSRISPT
jgi:hypothetical protein